MRLVTLLKCKFYYIPVKLAFKRIRPKEQQRTSNVFKVHWYNKLDSFTGNFISMFVERIEVLKLC